MEFRSSYRLEKSFSRRPNDDAQDHEQDPSDTGSQGRSTSGPPAVPTHCSVSGALALVLRLSRLIGIAPLDFERQDSDTWIIRVSKRKHIYGVVLIGTLNVMAILGLALDLIIDRENSVRMRAPTKSMIMLLVIINLILSSSICTLTAPALMKSMIGFLSRLHKIASDINNHSVPHFENKLKKMVVLLVCFRTLLFVINYYWTVTFALQNNRNMLVVFLKVSGVFLNIIHSFIDLQFTATALPIYSTLKAINVRLDRLCHSIQNEGLQDIRYDAEKEKNEISLVTNTIPLKSVNTAIDRITYNTDDLLPRKSSNQETIRTLVHSYFDVCKLIEEMNKCFLVRTMMILATTIIYFITTFYNLLTPLVLKADMNKTQWLDFLWGTTQLSAVILLVEPCHWIDQELTRTRQLMAQLTCRTVTAIGPLVVEVRRFFWAVLLNKVLPSSMGICMMARPLYVTILGVSATYLVIAMQFITEEDAKVR